jgi:hypothetical protein
MTSAIVGKVGKYPTYRTHIMFLALAPHLYPIIIFVPKSTLQSVEARPSPGQVGYMIGNLVLEPDSKSMKTRLVRKRRIMRLNQQCRRNHCQSFP